jgi:hypothetical protein
VNEDVSIWRAMMQKMQACVEKANCEQNETGPVSNKCMKSIHTLTLSGLVKFVADRSDYSNRDGKMPFVVRKHGVFSLRKSQKDERRNKRTAMSPFGTLQQNCLICRSM